ncbi:MAG: hypothetical protein ABL918_06175 [Chakrabartia sp.]
MTATFPATGLQPQSLAKNGGALVVSVVDVALAEPNADQVVVRV